MLIAVTGSNGFVGKNVCNHLESIGYSIRRIQRSVNENNFNINQINSKTCWELALRDVEIVIHCASKLDEQTGLFSAEIDSFEEVNFKGTRNLAEQCEKFGVRRFIFLSTIKVNGEFTSIGEPFNNNSFLNPKGEYALSKFNAEESIKSICKSTNMEYVIIRPSLIYGPGVKGNFYKLMKIVNTKVPIPLASIKNKRSILYIGNLVDFINSCLVKREAANKIFLLSDIGSLSTPKLIKELGGAFNIKVLMLFIPGLFIKLLSNLTRKTKQVEKLQGSLEIDPEESYKALDIKPRFSTAEGLKITASWYKDLRSN